MTYYIKLTVITKKTLGTYQQDKLRDAVLRALDDASLGNEILYDAATATRGEGA